MPKAPIAEKNNARWLMALVAAAGTTLAPSANAQNDDPISSMLQSIASGGDAGDLARPGQNQPADQRTNDEIMQALADDVNVDENMIVELHVQEEDLANVLQMLSIQSQRNIVSSRNVSATVTANLYGVTFYEALDAILHVNGYGYVEQGNFIYVYTLEEMATIEQAARQRVAKAITLDFLNAIDAAEFVTPLLSEGGFIKTNGRTEDFSVGGDAPVGADDYANTAMLVVFDYEENIAEIERLIAEIDTRPAQVLVEATIVQTSLNEANAFGVDFSIVSDLNIENFLNTGGPLGPVDGLLGGVGQGFSDGSAAQVGIPGDGVGRALQATPGNVAGGPATLKLGIIQDDISVFVRMLDEVSDTTILSSPKILALNRQPSRVLVGRKVGYLSTTSTETSTTQTVEFLDTGTQLYFRPFVSDDNMIRMELKPQVSEAIIRNQTDATGAAVTIPDEITNEIVTNVIVPDGHTIVLGGLFRESTSAARRQVPILGDLPLIGGAFRGHDDETDRQEIIFMIKPSILADDVLIAQGERSQDYVRRVRAGSREGLLPWSRERQASQLLVEAERLAAEGKIDQALHCVRRALEHNPFQADAIAMRERLTNDQANWPHRSLLQNIVSDELFEAPVDAAPAGTMGFEFTPAPQHQAAPTYSMPRSQAEPVSTSNAASPAIAAPQPVVQNETFIAAEPAATQFVVAPPSASPAASASEGFAHDTAVASSTPSAPNASLASESSASDTLVPTGGNTAVAASFSASSSHNAAPVSAGLQPTPLASAPVAAQQQSASTAAQQPAPSSFVAPASQPARAHVNPMVSMLPPRQDDRFGSAPSMFNDGSLRPTASASVNASAFSQPIEAATPAMPATSETTNTQAAATPAEQVQPAIASAQPSTSAPVTQPSAEAPAKPSVVTQASEFGLSDAEMQMLVLTEFFRSFDSVSKSSGPFTEVPLQGDSPE